MSQVTGTKVHGNLQSALNGRWQVVYQEIDGEAIRAEESPTTLELQGNEFKIEQNNAVTYEGTFTVRPGSPTAETPTEIVLLYRKSKTPLYLGGPRAGILQLEGDTLKFNFGGVGHSPPKSFNTYPGNESVLSVYQRESKATQAISTGPRTSQEKSIIIW